MPDHSLFSGRLIFDHLAKTAGQAVNRWLVDTLGAGNVTPNLQGGHRQLIQQYGGLYSVISGHLSFENSGLDPRYHYATCVREPVDRCVSWLFFVTNNIHKDALPYWHVIRQFIDTEGEDFDPSNPPFWPNTYVAHFAELSPTLLTTDQQQLDFSLDILREYSVIGTYDALPAFIERLAALLGATSAKPLKAVNTTRDRPAWENLPAPLLQRIRNLNAVDIEFYARFREMCDARVRTGPQVPAAQLKPRPAPAGWRLMPDTPRYVAADGITVLTAEVSPAQVTTGDPVEISITFAAAQTIAKPNITVDLVDSFGRKIFSLSTRETGPHVDPLGPGSFTFHQTLQADLPVDTYNVWLTLHDHANHQVLARCEALGRFAVRRPQHPAAKSPLLLASRHTLAASGSYQPRNLMPGDITVALQITSDVHFTGGIRPLTLHLRNTLDQLWRHALTRSIVLRLTWTAADGTAALTQDHPFNGDLPPNEDIAVTVPAQMPVESGSYRLAVELFVDDGLTAPVRLSDVATPLTIYGPETWALDARHEDYARTLTGRRDGNQIFTTATEGMLLYGPYLPLPTGRYHVRMQGRVDQPGRAWVEASHRVGQSILYRAALAELPPQEDGVIHAFGVTVGDDDDVCNLEIRIWVDATSVLTLDSVQLARCDTDR